MMAQAQEAVATDEPTAVEEVVVTGSFIAGTPTTAALPVAVLGAAEIQKRGNPTIVELMKTLPSSGGVLGDSNQYATTVVSAAPSTVNLRNLGPQRTLVLLNGRRLATFPSINGAVNLFGIPVAAVGRVEVLKDGAAATYGSDAIGGVVNFITQHNFNGLQTSGEIRYIPGADDPDYSGSVLFGWNGDKGNILLSAAMQTRGRLGARARDFNNVEYTENPEGGFSPTNNPTSFRPVFGASNTLGSQIRDPGCSTVGAVPAFVNNSQICFSRLAGLTVNLQDPQERYQLYGEANFDLDEDTKFHAEALYTQSYNRGFVSFFPATLNGPTAATSPFPGQFYAPISNPGLALLIKQFPNAFPAGTTGVVWPSSSNFRLYGLGGSVADENGPTPNSTFEETYRLSAELTGKFGGVGWNVATTYSVDTNHAKTSDFMIYRAQLALRGYGSLAGNPSCTAAVTNNFTTNAGNNAVGCYYFNPFSNAYAVNSDYFQQNPGVANPLFDPSVVNNVNLAKWINQPIETMATSRVFVLDAVLNGTIPGLKLWGGEIGWAAGGQFRRNYYTATRSDFSNAGVTPCVDTPLTGTKNCVSPVGPFALNAAAFSSDVQQNVISAFAELSLPITTDFQAHVAARYEDYGKNAGGSTFNPKLDLRWQALDWLAFRGSVGTTFRAPPLTLLDPTPLVATAQLAGAQRAVQTSGNPDLEPETATTFGIGAIIQAGNFKATVDYWNFDFSKPITSEPVATLFSLMFPNNTDVNCGNPAFADLQARFTFSPDVCSAFNTSLLRVSYVNTGGVKTDGIDVDATYDIDDFLDGGVRIGGSLSWVNKYQVAAQVVRGVTVAPAFDAVGKFNYQTGFFPLPQWKGSLYTEYNRGAHNLRLQANYTDGYYDQRAIFAGNLFVGDVANVAQATVVPRPAEGQFVKSFLTFDATYRWLAPWDATIVVGIQNLFDKDPPFVRTELNYDPTTASAYGRVYKLSVTKKF